jgi:predicted secreted protein
MSKRVIFTNILFNLVFLLNFFGYSFSQNMWTKTYGYKDFDAAYAILQTSDQGYIIGGLTQSYIWLIKTNSSGDTLWTKKFEGRDMEWKYKNSFLQIVENGYIIVGIKDGSDVWLIRTNDSGDTLWTKTYQGSSNQNVTSVQKTLDNGYIITGWTYFFHEISWADAYLIKTNSSGDTMWTKIYQENDFQVMNSVQQTSDGGYIMAGCTYDIFLEFDRDLLIKTNSSGDTIWTKTYNYNGDSYLFSVQQTLDDNYIIAGTTTCSSAGLYDAWLIKADSSGDTVWTKTFGGINSDCAYMVRQTPDQGFIIIGETESFGAGGKDVWLIKTNSSGDTIWTKTYGGTGDDVAYSITQTLDGGYIIAGKTESFGAGDSDVWLIKTDQDGNTEGITLIDNDFKNITPDDYKLYQNYPNPFNPTTKISYSVLKSGHVMIKIYNILGQEIQILVNKFQNAGYYTCDFNASNLPSGIYFYQFKVGNNIIETKKMLLIH